MNTAAIIGMIVASSLTIASMLAVRALTRFAYPWREQLFQAGAELLRKNDTTPLERACINRMLNDALSFSAGWQTVHAAWNTIGVDPETDKQKRRPGVDYEKLAPLTLRFMGSTLAANPIAAIAFIGLLVAQMVAVREAPKPAIRQAAIQMPFVHATA